MHEYPIAKNLIETCERYAREQHATAVTRIHLVVGESSGILVESIAMYMDLIAGGTMCAHAELDCERIPARLKCTKCGALFIRQPFSFACPHCGGDGEPTDIGREFLIKSIEIEK